MSSAAVVYCRASSEMSDAEVAICPNCLSAQPSKVTHLLHKHLAWPLQFCFLRLWNQHHNNGGRWHENCPCQSWGVQNWKTLVEHFLTNRGHKVFLISKFHCELNPIEKVWGQAKKIYSFAHQLYTSMIEADHSTGFGFGRCRLDPEVLLKSKGVWTLY